MTTRRTKLGAAALLAGFLGSMAGATAALAMTASGGSGARGGASGGSSCPPPGPPKCVIVNGHKVCTAPKPPPGCGG
jgi:hypothetical protein